MIHIEHHDHHVFPKDNLTSTCKWLETNGNSDYHLLVFANTIFCFDSPTVLNPEQLATLQLIDEQKDEFFYYVDVQDGVLLLD